MSKHYSNKDKLLENFFDDIDNQDIEASSEEGEKEKDMSNVWTIAFSVDKNRPYEQVIRSRGDLKKYMDMAENIVSIAIERFDTEPKFTWSYMYARIPVAGSDAYEKNLYDRKVMVQVSSMDNLGGEMSLCVNFDAYRLIDNPKNIIRLIKNLKRIFVVFKYTESIDIYAGYANHQMNWREMAEINNKTQILKSYNITDKVINDCCLYKMIKELSTDENYSYGQFLEDTKKIPNDFERIMRPESKTNLSQNDTQFFKRYGKISFDSEDYTFEIHNLFFLLVKTNPSVIDYKPISNVSPITASNSANSVRELMKFAKESKGGMLLIKCDSPTYGARIAYVFDGVHQESPGSEQHIVIGFTHFIHKDETFTTDIHDIYKSKSPDCVSVISALFIALNGGDVVKAEEDFDKAKQIMDDYYGSAVY